MSRAGTKGVPRAAREQQILDVAVAEIGRAGYAGLSVGEVATRAGVSKPLVYNYFDSKDGLYVACVHRAAETLTTAIEEADNGATGLELARRTLDAIFTALEPRPHDWNVLSDRSYPPVGPAADAVHAARRAIAEYAARGAATLFDTAALTDPADVSALTDVWMGIVTSLVQWWLRHPGETAAAMSARSERLFDAITTAPA